MSDLRVPGEIASAPASREPEGKKTNTLYLAAERKPEYPFAGAIGQFHTSEACPPLCRAGMIGAACSLRGKGFIICRRSWPALQNETERPCA